jgi:hypothetical protein
MRSKVVLLVASLIAEGAQAGATVPVEVQLLDPGTFVVQASAPGGGSNDPDISGPEFEWTAPAWAANGSGSFAFTAGPGTLEAFSSGNVSSAPPLAAGQGVHIAVRQVVPPRVELFVPDFGEAMTTVAFMKRSSENDLSGSAVALGSSCSVSFDDQAVSSTKLAGDYESDVGWGGNLNRAIRPDIDASELNGGGLRSFVAGDRVLLDIAVSTTANCNVQNSGDASCSVNWSHNCGFDVLAIVPEPQNRPQTQCFDQEDNDLDGLIDLADPDCSDPFDTTESPPPAPAGCGFGPELALLLPGLWWLRRRRGQPTV